MTKVSIVRGGSGSVMQRMALRETKQLRTVDDRPRLYYAGATLMQAGRRRILIITTPEDAPMFEQLLGDGSSWGSNLSYAQQPKPAGLAQAFLIG